MSQAGINNTSSGPVPPVVATQYNTDVNSPSIPSLNIENIIGGSIPVNTLSGIRTDGGAGSNTILIELTNRTNNFVFTTDATPADITTFDLGATPGVYTFDIQISSFNTTDTLGAGYSIFGSVRTDGSTAFLIGTPDKIVNEEIGDTACDATLTVAGNNAIVLVTGIAGKNIDWKAVSTYVFTS